MKSIDVSNNSLSDILTNGDAKSNNVSNASSLMKLLTGQSFEADILSIINGKVRLRLSNNQIINATLSDTVELTPGAHVTFVVKDQTSKLLIKPVPNSDGVPLSTIAKALDSASIVMNDETVNLVKNLMSHGYSIDKNTLNLVYNKMLQFPNATPDMIMRLHDLQIPVTGENIEQYTKYMDNQNSYNSNIDSVINSLMSESSINESSTNTPVNMLFDTVMKSVPFNPDIVDEYINSIKEDIKTTNFTNSINTSSLDIVSEGDNNLYSETNKAQVIEPKELVDEILKDYTPNADKDTNILKYKAIMNLSEENPQLLKELLNRDDFKSLVENILKDRWTINIKDLENIDGDKLKQGIKDKYNQAMEDVNQLLENLSKDTKAFNDLNHAAGNMKNNINFMESFTNVYGYFQVPVKFTQEKSGAELFVYGKRNNQKSNDDEVSAFLKLTMENLGATNVFVKLKSGHITTKFTLADNKSADLIEEHLPELKTILEDKGYSFEAYVFTDDTNKNNPINEIFKKEQGTSTVRRYNFDVRA